MAATIGYFYLKGASGRKYTLSVYNTASLAAGNYVPIDWNLPAVATSPTNFFVPEAMVAVDFVPTAATGVIEFVSAGRRTGVGLDYALFGATNSGRPVGSLPAFAPGTEYRLLVVSALAA